MGLTLIIQDMMAHYEDIDRQTADFAAQSGLQCRKGCGACCENPQIETTVAEVLPLAKHLWEQGLAENKLESIRSNSANGVCAFYQPEAQNPGHGRCGIYAYRPGLCRLFGFAARKDKNGQPVLVTCKVIKDLQPQIYQRTQEELSHGRQVPSLSAHAFAVANIDPVHGQKLLPINQAIEMAIEITGYNNQKQQLPSPTD